MAHSKQAKKRIRLNEDCRMRNKATGSAYRTEVKKLLKLLDAGDKENAQSQVRVVESKVDIAAKHRVIHSRTASRIKSRLKVRVAALSQDADETLGAGIGLASFPGRQE